MKKLRLNMIFGFITRVAVILTGIIAQRFVLKSFGSEINGLTSSVTQFLTYFALLEAGLADASVQALYKPLASKDKNKVEGILSATSIQYRRIGITSLVLVLLLAAIMPKISHSSLNEGVVFLITFLALHQYMFL